VCMCACVFVWCLQIEYAPWIMPCDPSRLLPSAPRHIGTHNYTFVYSHAHKDLGRVCSHALTQILAVSLLTWRARRAARSLMQPA